MYTKPIIGWNLDPTQILGAFEYNSHKLAIGSAVHWHDTCITTHLDLNEIKGSSDYNISDSNLSIVNSNCQTNSSRRVCQRFG